MTPGGWKFSIFFCLRSVSIQAFRQLRRLRTAPKVLTACPALALKRLSSTVPRSACPKQGCDQPPYEASREEEFTHLANTHFYASHVRHPPIDLDPRIQVVALLGGGITQEGLILEFGQQMPAESLPTDKRRRTQREVGRNQ